jgi:hypothetical protein
MGAFTEGMFVRSTDGGLTFSAPMPVDDDFNDQNNPAGKRTPAAYRIFPAAHLDWASMFALARKYWQPWLAKLAKQHAS